MGLKPGQMLQNRYRIVSMLGQGGMGAVYQAWDTRLNIPVALKEMVPQPGIDAGMLAQLRQQFRQEAQVLARLSHPNLVGVTDFFEKGGNAYLVMNFVEGESLAETIERQGALPESQVLAWADQLLDALDYCHSRGVIHRDIKPQNVIIRSDGRAVLVDFGLVKLWDPRDPRTRTAVRGMGTPEYAPPEQYGARPGHTDPRSDLYSLGATLYHALTGQAPPGATERMAYPDRFPSPRSLNVRVSPRTEAAVLRAMELAVTSRFANAAEMRAALRGQAAAPAPPPAPIFPPPRPATGTRVIEERAVSAPPVAAERPRRRVKGWLWAVVGLLIVGLIGGGLWWQQQVQQEQAAALRATSYALAQSDAATAQAAEQATAIALVAEQATATAQAQATATAQARATATAQAQATATAQARATATAQAQATATARAYANRRGISAENASNVSLFSSIQAHNDRATCVKFSPDGRLLASGSDDTTIKLWNIASGKQIFTMKGHQSYVWGLAFSPDGTLLASVSDDNTMRIWDLNRGTSIRVLEGYAGVAFSPDGQVLASGLRNGSVKLWRVADGALLRTLSRHSDFVVDVAFSPDGQMLASASADATVRLWRVADGALLRTLKGHTDYVLSVAFSPDGQTLASGSGDGTVRLWRVADGLLVRTLNTHTDGVGNVIFNPQGDILVATAGNWGKPTIWIWRVSDWNRLLKIEVEGAEAFRDSAFDPLGRFFATASHDGVVRLWGVRP